MSRAKIQKKKREIYQITYVEPKHDERDLSNIRFLNGKSFTYHITLERWNAMADRGS